MPIFKVLTTPDPDEHTNEPKLAKKMEITSQINNSNMPEFEGERKHSSPSSSSPVSLVSAADLLNKINIDGIGISQEKPEITDNISVIIKNDKFIVTASQLELTAMKSLPKALKDAYVVCKVLMDLLYYSPRLESLDDYLITNILPTSYELKNTAFQLCYDEQALKNQNLACKKSEENVMETKLQNESHEDTVAYNYLESSGQRNQRRAI